MPRPLLFLRLYSLLPDYNCHMLRILLLDCSEPLEKRLSDQGFDVKSGTVGFCTGARQLPCQVYERDIFIYNPDRIATETIGVVEAIIAPNRIRDHTPQYSLEPLQARIERGATFLAFANRLSAHSIEQNMVYGWIPFMPELQPTEDRSVSSNTFNGYPDLNRRLFAPIIAGQGLQSPVLLKMKPPNAQDYPRDVFWLFWNNNIECLGVLIERGKGRLIVLPKFTSNDTVAETFLHRVVPHLYNLQAPASLIEKFTSPAEAACRIELCRLESTRNETEKRIEDARVRLNTARREKSSVIDSDATAKQIQTYYNEALRQPDAALFYLYKAVESIENKLGGESAAIAAVGAGSEWKAVKRLANESYRDARHAPKPTDIIKKWSQEEIKKCFEDTDKVLTAYFATLF